MQQRLTLADIAEQAGVSTATVSRVLNGKSNVADVTRRQVLVALDLLGYERPETLRQSSRGLIGLVVPELNNPIFPAYAQEIEQPLASSGHTPLLCTQTPGGTSEDEYIEMLVDRGVSGIVFVSGRHSDTSSDVTRYQRLRERGVPLVTINGNAPTIKAPGFPTDDRAAARIAVPHQPGALPDRTGHGSSAHGPRSAQARGLRGRHAIRTARPATADRRNPLLL